MRFEKRRRFPPAVARCYLDASATRAIHLTLCGHGYAVYHWGNITGNGCNFLRMNTDGSLYHSHGDGGSTKTLIFRVVSDGSLIVVR